MSGECRLSAHHFRHTRTDMIFNSNVFLLARPPHLILWNCETHEQFELSATYQNRLMQLIRNPKEFDSLSPIDAEFLSTGIIKSAVENDIIWEWDALSKLFHVGTKNIPLDDEPVDSLDWANQYANHCEEILSKPQPRESFEQGSETIIALPPPTPKLADLTDILTSRKTSRTFYEDSINLETIASILYYSLGYLRERKDEESKDLATGLDYRRSSPSGGGLNSTEGYVWAYDVEAIPPAIYYYNPKAHSLEYRSALPSCPIGSLLNGQHFVNSLPFGVFLTSRLDKLWWKYEHSRAYRMALVEVGHIAQTFQLLATSNGLQTWLTGALNESSIENLIRSETGTEEVLFFVGAGWGDGKAIPAALQTETKRRVVND